MRKLDTLSESRVPEIGTPGLMSGIWKRGTFGATAPDLDSTVGRTLFMPDLSLNSPERERYPEMRQRRAAT